MQTTTNTAKKPEIDQVINTINRKLGEGSIFQLKDSSRLRVTTFKSGIPALDEALGGGWPRGRIIEMFGQESSGKTTLALLAIKEIQEEGGTAAFIDMEHALDPDYGHRLGVATHELLVSQPNNGESAMTIVEELVRSKAVNLIVVDSTAALVTQPELDDDMSSSYGPAIACLLSKALRRLMNVMHEGCTIIFLSQMRTKQGVSYGSPEISTGGNALKYYSTIRVQLQCTQNLLQGMTVHGIRIHAKTMKNKMAPPFRSAEIDLGFNGSVLPPKARRR